MNLNDYHRDTESAEEMKLAAPWCLYKLVPDDRYSRWGIMIFLCILCVSVVQAGFRG